MKSGKQLSSRMTVARRYSSAMAAIAMLWLAPTCSALAQEGESPLTLAREAYDAAIDVWVALQGNLTEEMKALPAEAARSKLLATEKARQAVARTRLSYLTNLSRAYADFAAGLRAVGSAPDTTTDQLLSADKAMLSDLDAAVALLDSDIKTAAAADRPRAAALQKQKTDLLELRSLALRRGRELDRLESVRELAKERRESLAKSYTRLAEWASAVAAAAAKEEEVWEAAYTAIRDQISDQPREKVVERPAPETEPAPPTPPAQAAPTPAQISGSVLVPNIGGLWQLNNPRAKKLPSGAYEPASARLEINQNGTDVEGSFECTFAVPPDEPFNPVVRFNFTGKITNPILRFNITAPLTGTILLRQADAGTIEVSYGISNPQKTGIAFGAVPDDGPQVLRKTLR